MIIADCRSLVSEYLIVSEYDHHISVAVVANSFVLLSTFIILRLTPVPWVLADIIINIGQSAVGREWGGGCVKSNPYCGADIGSGKVVLSC